MNKQMFNEQLTEPLICLKQKKYAYARKKSKTF